MEAISNCGPSRREFLAGSLALGLGRLGARGPDSASYNLVLLLPDQLRAHDLEAYGGSVMRTPRIDALAKESLVFDRALVTTPVCSAYRTQLMTGLYTHTTGNKLTPESDTLYRRLEQAGWHVGHIGKWHMTPQELLTESGYVPAGIRGGVAYSAMVEVAHKYQGGVWFLDDDPTPRPCGEWEPDLQADLAVDYLKRRQEDGRPFFLTLALGPPHQPYEPHPRHDTFEPEEIRLRQNVPRRCEEVARSRIARYYGLMASVDEVVGRVLDALTEKGLDASTLVVFTSDHGDMLFSQGEEYKRRPWEESIGVPLFLRFPPSHPRDRAGRTRDILRTADLLPTFLDLLDVEPPSGLHGRSFFGAPPLEAAYLEQVSGVNAPFRSPWRGVVTADGWKWATSLRHGPWILHDLNEDPLEMDNQVRSIQARDRRRDLEALVRELAKELEDPFPFR